MTEPTKYDTFRELIWRGFTKFAIDPGPEEDAEVIVNEEPEVGLPFE